MNQRHITTLIKCNKCHGEVAKYYPTLTCGETEATHSTDFPKVNPDVHYEMLKRKTRQKYHWDWTLLISIPLLKYLLICWWEICSSCFPPPNRLRAQTTVIKHAKNQPLNFNSLRGEADQTWHPAKRFEEHLTILPTPQFRPMHISKLIGCRTLT